MFGLKPRQQTLPLLIIEEFVCFPHSITPLYINARPALKAVDVAMADKRQILVVYKATSGDIQGRQSFADIATLGRITQVMKLPNNAARILLESTERVRLLEVDDIFGSPTGNCDTLDLDYSLSDALAVRMRSLLETFQRYAALHKKIPQEVMTAIVGADNPHRLVDLCMGAATIPIARKHPVFQSTEALYRLEETIEALEGECQLLDLKQDIQGRVKRRLEQHQKEHFINEQIRELNKEMGKEDEDSSGVKELERRFADLELSDDLRSRLQTELKRLGRLPPMTPEAGILRTWLDLIADLPWKSAELPAIDPEHCQAILDEDHFDLEDPKERIVDYLAARTWNPDIRSPILCLVGPPGTGKTSLARSIARALGRSYVRISLGGVRDEAEIRGHRRTYVGALPGKIIQGMKKAKSKQPVFLLDEIDKMSQDNRGDPASALLEILDPEQNHNFQDHYLDVPYDLSGVLFIATANTLSTIPHALRDRLEIIEIPGYTPLEKQKIAERFIVPRQLKEHGLAEQAIAVDDEALKDIIESHTNEAGVRQLDRAIATIVRKAVRRALGQNGPETFTPCTISPADVKTFLKRPRHKPDIVREDLPPGLAYGLAWTETGGTVLPVEVTLSAGRGEFILTGSLGDVMKESARIAHSLLRARGLVPGGAKTSRDIHIHVPEGAIPKDGPSAGITLCTALRSALGGASLPGGLAMTGELTLSGRVLAVGGIREKVLAAHRLGFRTILLPAANEHEAREIPEEVRACVDLVLVHTIDEVFARVFGE